MTFFHSSSICIFIKISLSLCVDTSSELRRAGRNTWVIHVKSSCDVKIIRTCLLMTQRTASTKEMCITVTRILELRADESTTKTRTASLDTERNTRRRETSTTRTMTNKQLRTGVYGTGDVHRSASCERQLGDTLKVSRERHSRIALVLFCRSRISIYTTVRIARSMTSTLAWLCEDRRRRSVVAIPDVDYRY